MLFFCSPLSTLMAQHFLIITLLILASAIREARANALVTGSVFCDQCKDGQRSLFDYPLYGVRVLVNCSDGSGRTTMSKQETTSLFGTYTMSFDGAPDLSGCQARVLPGSNQDSNGCAAAAGPPQELKLTFRMFDMEMYNVDSLFAQPAQPMSFCPKSSGPVPVPVPVPAVPTTPPPPPILTPPPVFRLPPMPPLPPLPPLPPVPFMQASACSHQMWMMPEHKCYWRLLDPDWKVAVVFGPIAARRYGNGVTLWQSLQLRGDPYKTLLREGTTALLNAYNSVQFPYHSLDVITRMNNALMGSKRSILFTALRFIRANSGSGSVGCNLTPCKSSSAPASTSQH